MSKRRHERFIKRLETEFSFEDKSYRGISSDLSCEGLFIRTKNAFPPGSAIDIRLHLPDGSVSNVKGQVKRALKTNITTSMPSIKNGMGILLTEKDVNYTKYMVSFPSDCLDSAPTEDMKESPEHAAPDIKTSQEPSAPDTEEFQIIACSACGVKNKVRRSRLSAGPRCGKCGSTLSAPGA